MIPPELSALFKGTVFVSAGEPSADLYAALFIRQIRKTRPGLRFIGIGGPDMAAAGVELLDDFRRLMSFGFAAAAQNISGNAAMYRMIARSLCRLQPDIFMPVAYPGLNLLLCRYAKKIGTRSCYFLPPQIWAWGNFRKCFIKKWVDQVVSFFPFEYEYYRRCRIPAVLVDNPLMDHLASYRRTDRTLTIGFMPGSRPREIKRNISVIMKIMRQLKADYKAYRFLTILREKMNLPDALCSAAYPALSDRYQAMKNCDLIITSSGSASLETAFLGVPQVFFNRPAFIDYHLARRMVAVKEYNLVNLYHGRKIVPVIIGRDPDRIERLIEIEINRLLKR